MDIQIVQLTRPQEAHVPNVLLIVTLQVAKCRVHFVVLNSEVPGKLQHVLSAPKLLMPEILAWALCHKDCVYVMQVITEKSQFPEELMETKLLEKEMTLYIL
jgi:hypothetical protein